MPSFTTVDIIQMVMVYTALTLTLILDLQPYLYTLYSFATMILDGSRPGLQSLGHTRV